MVLPDPIPFPHATVTTIVIPTFFDSCYFYVYSILLAHKCLSVSIKKIYFSLLLKSNRVIFTLQTLATCLFLLSIIFIYFYTSCMMFKCMNGMELCEYNGCLSALFSVGRHVCRFSFYTSKNNTAILQWLSCVCFWWACGEVFLGINLKVEVLEVRHD